MTYKEIWKNFSLGTELTISGNFIFNGLQTLDMIENLYYEDESFEFFYNISVGIERLQKIVLVLIEHDEFTDQKKFETSLISHVHTKLHERIKKSRDIIFGNELNDFLNCLTNFYKNHRYGNFVFSNLVSKDKPNVLLAEFVEKHLKCTIHMELHGSTYIDQDIKKFISVTVGELCELYYKQIEIECERLNLYTYEVGYDSKAFKIFLSKKYDFFEEKKIQKEIIKYLVQSEKGEKFNNFINKQPALDFEYYDVNHLIRYLMQPTKEYSVKGEVDDLYAELADTKSRLKHLQLIGNECVKFS